MELSQIKFGEKGTERKKAKRRKRTKNNIYSSDPLWRLTNLKLTIKMYQQMRVIHFSNVILYSKREVSDVKRVTRGVREAYFTFHEY
jgi:hypothetical protein